MTARVQRPAEHGTIRRQCSGKGVGVQRVVAIPPSGLVAGAEHPASVKLNLPGSEMLNYKAGAAAVKAHEYQRAPYRA